MSVDGDDMQNSRFLVQDGQDYYFVSYDDEPIDNEIDFDSLEFLIRGKSDLKILMLT